MTYQRRPITIHVQCPACKGTGKVRFRGTRVDCYLCGGWGKTTTTIAEDYLNPDAVRNAMAAKPTPQPATGTALRAEDV
jgi:hypothetical protein